MKLGQFIELSHRLTPGAEEFPLEITTFKTDEVLGRIERRQDIWYILQEVKMGSHVGTHVEFPYHRLQDGKTAADYPLARLVGTAVVLDFSHKGKDQEITRTDIEQCGVEIRRGDIVFVRTDMDKRWRTPQGHDRPVLAIEATRYLVEEIGIHCIGTDATGLEVRGRDDQPVHEILFTHDVAMVESLRGLEQLTKPRFMVFILPLMIEGLDACPVRVVAMQD
jgi:arylformamidase